MGLVRVTPPAVEPVTLEEAKLHLALGGNDHDAYVASLVEAATEAAEWLTWRALVTQSWRLVIDEFPCRLWLPRPPLQRVDEIEYVAASGEVLVLDENLYHVADGEPASIEPAYGETWPATRPERGAVRVTFVAGYGDDGASVPRRVRQAILLLVGNWFANRESVMVGAGAAVPLPQNALWLLEAFRTGVPAEWFLPDA